LEELLLRIKKLIDKRDKMNANDKALPNIFHFGNNWINFDSHQAKGVDGLIELTKKETLLLKLLIENKNTVVSREHILKVVWDYNVIPNTRTVDNFMLSLRKYFEADPKNPVFLHSSRGIGYKFVEQEAVTV
jgi:two-component system alkaline phosphatase synthesis response regulator PhoP